MCERFQLKPINIDFLNFETDREVLLADWEGEGLTDAQIVSHEETRNGISTKESREPLFSIENKKKFVWHLYNSEFNGFEFSCEIPILFKWDGVEKTIIIEITGRSSIGRNLSVGVLAIDMGSSAICASYIPKNMDRPKIIELQARGKTDQKYSLNALNHANDEADSDYFIPSGLAFPETVDNPANSGISAGFPAYKRAVKVSEITGEADEFIIPPKENMDEGEYLIAPKMYMALNGGKIPLKLSKDVKTELMYASYVRAFISGYLNSNIFQEHENIHRIVLTHPDGMTDFQVSRLEAVVQDIVRTNPNLKALDGKAYLASEAQAVAVWYSNLYFPDTFGKVKLFTPNLVVCFDMGAGTLDLSVVDFHDVQPLSNIGAPMGGDVLETIITRVLHQELKAIFTEESKLYKLGDEYFKAMISSGFMNSECRDPLQGLIRQAKFNIKNESESLVFLLRVQGGKFSFDGKLMEIVPASEYNNVNDLIVQISEEISELQEKVPEYKALIADAEKALGSMVEAVGSILSDVKSMIKEKEEFDIASERNQELEKSILEKCLGLNIGPVESFLNDAINYDQIVKAENFELRTFCDEYSLMEGLMKQLSEFLQLFQVPHVEDYDSQFLTSEYFSTKRSLDSLITNLDNRQETLVELERKALELNDAKELDNTLGLLGFSFNVSTQSVEIHLPIDALEKDNAYRNYIKFITHDMPKALIDNLIRQVRCDTRFILHPVISGRATLWPGIKRKFLSTLEEITAAPESPFKLVEEYESRVKLEECDLKSSVAQGAAIIAKKSPEKLLHKKDASVKYYLYIKGSSVEPYELTSQPQKILIAYHDVFLLVSTKITNVRKEDFSSLRHFLYQPLGQWSYEVAKCLALTIKANDPNATHEIWIKLIDRPVTLSIGSDSGKKLVHKWIGFYLSKGDAEENKESLFEVEPYTDNNGVFDLLSSREDISDRNWDLMEGSF